MRNSDLQLSSEEFRVSTDHDGAFFMGEIAVGEHSPSQSENVRSPAFRISRKPISEERERESRSER